MKQTIKQSKKEVPPQGKAATRPQQKPEWLEFRRPYLAGSILILLVLLVYAQTAFFDFTNFDDGDLVRDNIPVLRDLSNLKKLVFTDVSLGTMSPIFYRPVQMISYMLDTVVGGAKPSSYHITNVLLHAAVCCALYALFLLLRMNKSYSFLAAAVFAVHPVFVQSVSWIPSRGDLLITLFGTLGFIFLIQYLRNKNPVFLIAHGLMVLLALFSKETAVLLPLMFLLYWFLFAKQKRSAGSLLPPGLVWFAVLLVWYLLRSQVITGNYGANITGLPVLLHNLPAIPEFLAIFVLPIFLSPVPVFSSLHIFIGLLTLAGLAFLLFVKRKRPDPMFLFGLIWFAAFLLPGLWYRHNLGSNAYDYLSQRLYLPAIGITLALMVILSAVSAAKKKWIVIAGSAVTVLFAVFSTMLAGNYSNPQRLYDYAIRTNPDCALMLSNRGKDRFSEGKYPEAMADLERAVALVPNYSQALNNRGCVYFGQAQYRNAITDFGTAARLDASYAQAFANRGAAYFQISNLDSAMLDFSRVIALKPSSETALVGRGAIRRIKGDFSGSISDFNEALRTNPPTAEVLVNRGKTYMAMGKPGAAETDFLEAIKIKRDYLEAYFSLANLNEYSKKLPDEAERYYQEAIALKPEFAGGYIQHGLFAFRRKNYSAAFSEFTKAIERDPRSADAYQYRGVTRDALGEVENAIRDLSEAIRINPGHALAYKNRGVLRYRRKDQKGACEDWSMSRQLGSAEAAQLLQQYCK
jgi:protein O-mannosyl-transferase